MFDVGFTELMFIGVIALVVIGPERLPAVARTAGKWVNKMQRFVKGVKSDFASEFESGELKKLIGDQRDQISELRDMVDSAKKDFQKSSQEIVRDANESMSSLEDSSKLSDDNTVGSSSGSENGTGNVAEDSTKALSSDVSASKAESSSRSESTGTGTGGST